MPLTSAERKQKYLEKLKSNGEYEMYKEKKAASAKKRRDSIKIGLEQLPKAVREKTKRLNREYMRKKVAECRHRKKGLPVETTAVVASDSSPSIPEGGYNTTSALDKAVAKMKRAAPSTSVKCKQAVIKYLKSFDPKDQQEILQAVTKKTVKVKSTRAISSTVVEFVKSFYLRDDISRISPNMRDCRRFVDPITGLIEMKSIRYLMYKLEDVYNLFVKVVQKDDAMTEPPIKPTKFYQLRPQNVKLVNSTPLDMCFCYYHTNFILLCLAINRYLPEFPKYGEQLEQLILCEPPQKTCWWRNCSQCSKKIQKALDDIVKRSGKKLGIRVEWTQWAKNIETNRFQKHVTSGTLADLKKRFLDVLPEFLKHSYIKRCQATSFESDNEEVRQSNGKVALAQIDFPEGFTCQSQDEIQPAHWNQATV